MKRDKLGRFMKGHKPLGDAFKSAHIYNKEYGNWNKGLTKETDERVKRLGEITKKRMTGKQFSQNTKDKMKESGKDKIFSLKHKINLSKALKGKSKSEEHKQNIKKARAKRILPVKDTKIEVKIQNFLKQLGIEFFTHQYIKINHGYQCDILIPSLNLVIECDGDYWHKYPIGNDLDNIRTKELIQKGFKVLRLWECEIKKMCFNNFNNILNNCKEVV